MRSTVLSGLLFCAALSAAPPNSKHYYNSSGTLTASSSRPAAEVALQFVREAAPLHNLSAQDVDSIYLVKQYRTAHNGVTHFVFRQQFGGVDVRYSDFVVNIDASGRIINAGGNLYPAPAAETAAPSARSLSPSIRA